MKITANGYDYPVCECDEPETTSNQWETIGDVDYQICDTCNRPIAGTAATA